MTDAQKREFIHSFIKRVEIYPEKQPDGRILKSIEFNFPVWLGEDFCAPGFPDEKVTPETVCLLSKLRTEQKVEIDLDLSELDLTAAESKATYDQIKEHVLKTHGFQVTSLQIAQTKRKLGLPVGPNFNPSKKEDPMIPQCPPEKEQAIKETLQHFGMM